MNTVYVLHRGAGHFKTAMWGSSIMTANGKRMEIPFFNYPAIFTDYEDAYVEKIKDVGRRGAFIMQRDLEEFEAKLAAYLDVKHAIGMADGTMALYASLVAAGIGDGDEVLVPSHTFVASAAAIHHAGAVPILVDCARDHLIDTELLAQAVTPRTKAIMPVQLNGRVAQMDKIEQVASQRDLRIVEDSCQALGAKYKGRFAGTFGDAGTFSFFPAKTLGCFGDGGAIVTDSDDMHEIILEVRDHGRGKSGKVERWGFNARLDNLHAAILSLKLDRYDEAVQRRREIAGLYQKRLGDIEELLLPPGPDDNEDHFDVYQNYEIEAENRDQLREHLQRNGIGTIVQWGGYTVHQFEALGLNSDLVRTEEMTEKFLLLPLNTSISDEQVEYISEHIRSFYR